MKDNLVVVFDLDDTLYKEIDFLKSAFQDISNYLSQFVNIGSDIIFEDMYSSYMNGCNAFEDVIKFTGVQQISTTDLVHRYRQHIPTIYLEDSVWKTLIYLKEKAYKVGLITDGRSIQQRNKLKALKLIDYFDDIIISEEFGTEKPDLKNYLYYETKYSQCKYIYIGDNTSKDFKAPNQLGWYTVCLLDDGRNIHKQCITINQKESPIFIVNAISDIKCILKNNVLWN